MSELKPVEKPAGRPPRLAERILRGSLPPRDRAVLLGDFEEFYTERAARSGPSRAGAWYWMQAARSIPRFLLNAVYWGLVMLRNSIMVALRHMRRNRTHALINLVGLAMGMACCILIYFFIRHEWRWDRFHANVDRIHEIKGTIDFGRAMASVDAQPPLGPTLPDRFPEVERSARMSRETLVFSREDQLFEETGLAVDPDFFLMFSVPMDGGDPARVLLDPRAVVLSQKLSRRFFGGASAVGRILAIRLQDEFVDFRVAGVTRKLPSNSSLGFDFLLNIESVHGDQLHDWRSGRHVPTFLLLRDGVESSALEEKFPATIDSLMRRRFKGETGYRLQAFADYHLRGERDCSALIGKSRPAYSFILGGIALLVLLIACVNFTNLSIAGASRRLQEVGVRKVLGAGRPQLRRRFWSEALFLSLSALLLGIVLAELFRPTFNALSGRDLRLDLFGQGAPWVVLLGFALGVGGLSGFYPALVLARQNVAVLLRGKARLGGRGSLSRILIVVQFGIATALMVTTLVMARQNRFLLNKELGFDPDRVIVIPLEQISGHIRIDRAFYRTFKSNLLGHASIRAVSGARFGLTQYWIAQAPETPDGERAIIVVNEVDGDYHTVLGMTIVQGRDFSADPSAEEERAVIVNQAFVRRFNLTSPVGSLLSEPFKDEMPGRIIGVVKDFHQQSLHAPIRPAFVSLPVSKAAGGSPPPARVQNNLTSPADPVFKVLYVRVGSGDVAAGLEVIRREYRRLLPDIPFLYSFMDEDIARQYTDERRWRSMVSWASLFAIAIACAGLFGLTLITVAARTKEIGIRRVLGASVWRLMRMINREFLGLVLAANLLAWPTAYFAMHRLLQNYAFRVSIGVWLFPAAGLTAAALAVMTVSWHALRVARADPVEALRYE